MADRASKIARSLNVPHLTMRIPWGEPPFPPLPVGDEPIENIARAARYRVKFDAMTQCSASALAMGHHADDQVETSLMRIAKGTTESGAGGMRRCRRWGMGVGRAGELGWSGHEGLRRWIIRPLLPLSKDRILATCEAHGLDYVTDQTNFQPELTLRNSIRHLLKNPSPSSEDLQDLAKKMPPHIAEGLRALQTRSSAIKSVSMDISEGSELLRASVEVLSRQVDDTDQQVDRHLRRARIPSPVGTFMLSTASLQTITDSAIRTRMALRITRYASFHPWGSLRADGNRRSASFSRIIANLWHPEPWNVGSFVAGGGVIWIPAVSRDGRVRLLQGPTPVSLHAGDTCGWVTARQPPLHRDKMRALGIENPLRINITQHILSALRSERETLEVLYDCRFLVTLDLQKMPDDLRESLLDNPHATVRIEPNLRWCWPKIIWDDGRAAVTTLSSEVIDEENALRPWDAHNEDISEWQKSWNRIDDTVQADWICMQWIRPLDAL
ncbi:hypothetical protein HGRIS_012773 [Hohenbuehelia grisea]|uniref:tRNA(Ile)-lysidine synthetase n=1 Tax=Hohenbuehelia grisea TaxID=104357 RepID=A0ABR3ITC5_9AGAR